MIKFSISKPISILLIPLHSITDLKSTTENIDINGPFYLYPQYVCNVLETLFKRHCAQNDDYNPYIHKLKKYYFP